MEEIQAIIQINLPFILAGLLAAVVLLFILCIILFVKIKHEKKRYDVFMGTNRRPNLSLEGKLTEYFEKVTEVDEKYTKLLNMVTDIDATMSQNIQKIGFVRYNPFDEMGGNLCFAVALLDKNDTGIVLNGIHSRTGSFTYAKPIELGVSTYILSVEEKQAIELAKENAHQPKFEKVVKAKKKPMFRRKPKEEKEEIPEVVEPQKPDVPDTPKELEEVYKPTVTKRKKPQIAKQKMVSVGDVTTDEREEILTEETNAQKIINAQSFEERERIKKETRKPPIKIKVEPVIKVSIPNRQEKTAASNENLNEDKEEVVTQGNEITSEQIRVETEEITLQENVSNEQEITQKQQEKEEIEMVEQGQSHSLDTEEVTNKLEQIAVDSVSHDTLTDLLSDFDVDKVASKYIAQVQHPQGGPLSDIVENINQFEMTQVLEEEKKDELQENDKEQLEGVVTAEIQTEEEGTIKDVQNPLHEGAEISSYVVEEGITEEGSLHQDQEQDVTENVAAERQEIGPRTKRRLFIDDLVEEDNWKSYLETNKTTDKPIERQQTIEAIVRERYKEMEEAENVDVADAIAETEQAGVNEEVETEATEGLKESEKQEQNETISLYDYSDIDLEEMHDYGYEEEQSTSISSDWKTSEEEGYPQVLNTTESEDLNIYELDDELKGMHIYEYEDSDDLVPVHEYKEEEAQPQLDLFSPSLAVEAVEENAENDTISLIEPMVENETAEEGEGELSQWELFRRKRLLRMKENDDDE